MPQLKQEVWQFHRLSCSIPLEKLKSVSQHNLFRHCVWFCYLSAGSMSLLFGTAVGRQDWYEKPGHVVRLHSGKMLWSSIGESWLLTQNFIHDLQYLCCWKFNPGGQKPSQCFTVCSSYLHKGEWMDIYQTSWSLSICIKISIYLPLAYFFNILNAHLRRL